jgi:hypothetical protein
MCGELRICQALKRFQRFLPIRRARVNSKAVAGSNRVEAFTSLGFAPRFTL